MACDNKHTHQLLDMSESWLQNFIQPQCRAANTQTHTHTLSKTAFCLRCAVSVCLLCAASCVCHGSALVSVCVCAHRGDAIVLHVQQLHLHMDPGVASGLFCMCEGFGSSDCGERPPQCLSSLPPPSLNLIDSLCLNLWGCHSPTEKQVTHET